MKKLLPNIQGSFHINLDSHKGINRNSLRKALVEYTRSQYPSRYHEDGHEIHFSNRLFRFKVSRSRNYIRAFSKGFLKLKLEEQTLYIQYEGHLYRGVFIAAIQALLVFGIFLYAAPTYWWFAIIMFAMGYLLQVYTTHIVFPQALGKHIHSLMVEREK